MNTVNNNPQAATNSPGDLPPPVATAPSAAYLRTSIEGLKRDKEAILTSKQEIESKTTPSDYELFIVEKELNKVEAELQSKEEQLSAIEGQAEGVTANDQNPNDGPQLPAEEARLPQQGRIEPEMGDLNRLNDDILPDRPIYANEANPEINIPGFRAARDLGDLALARFDSFSDTARNIFNNAVERAYDTPVLGRIVGKLGTAYNQFWANRNENKAVKIKSKVDTFDMQINSFNEVKRELQTEIDTMKRQGEMGFESLELRIRDINQQQSSLESKRNKVRSKLEDRERRVESFTNSRDAIANELISRYNEKLRPMLQEIERLNTTRDHIDLSFSVFELRQKESMARIAEYEQRKARLADVLKRSGQSDRSMARNDALRLLDNQVAAIHNRIRADKRDIEARYKDVDSRITKVSKRANPYLDKREEFARITSIRSIDMPVPARINTPIFEGRAQINLNQNQGNVEPNPAPVAQAPRAPEINMEHLTPSNFVTGWNAFLEETYPGAVANDTVNLEDFTRQTGLSNNRTIEFNDFKKIVTRYYKFRKMPNDKLSRSIDTYFETKVRNRQ
jgi:hypothetical protein